MLMRLQSHCRVLFLLCFFSSISPAQWYANGVAICDTSSSGSQDLLPVISPDGNGGAYVVWRDARGGTGYDVFCQRIDSLGMVQWQRNGIPVIQAPNDQDFPRVCTNGDGGLFVAWEDTRIATTTYIYAQRLTSMGQQVWPDSGVRVSEMPGLFASIASDKRGGLLVAWNFLDGISRDDVFAQRLDSTGTPVWGDSGVYVSTRPEGVSSNEISIMSDLNGGAIVSWIEGNATFSQRIDSTGNPLWTNNGISLSGTSLYSRFALAQVPDGSGGAIDTWTRSPNTGVYLQRVSSSGQIMFPDTGLYVDNGGSARQMVADDNGNSFVLVGAAPNSLKVYQIDNSGNKIQPSGSNVSSQMGIQETAMASDGAGGVFCTWSKIDSNETNIYSQWNDASGSTQYFPDGSILCNAASLQEYPVLANTGFRQAIAVWGDHRNSGYWSIYAAKLSTTGVVSVRTKSNVLPSSFRLFQNYPNPFNPSTVIEFQVDKREYVVVEIVNILGERVKSLFKGVAEVGLHRIVWDARGFPSGVYFCRIIAEGISASRKMVLVR